MHALQFTAFAPGQPATNTGNASNPCALRPSQRRCYCELIENWIDETERRTWFLSEIVAEH